MKKISYSVGFFLLAGSGWAVRKTGFGAVADNLLGPVSFASDFVFTACFIIGASFIFASLVKYMEYRRNPLMTTIGTPIFLLIAGIFLLSLPFANYLIKHGTSYTLFKTAWADTANMEMQADPEKFGQRILTAEMACATAKKDYQAKEQEVKTLLEQVGQNTPG